MFDYPKARPYLVLMPERALGRSASGVAFSLLYAVAVAGCGRPDKGQTTSEGRALAAIAFVQMDYATPQTPVSTVTVPFTAPAQWPDIRILEYSGLDQTNPVDVTASSTGISSTSSTPAVTTANASDLLFAANIVTSLTGGAGNGWTNRVITNPDGDIAEDRTVSVTGSYTSTAPLLSQAGWVMQMVAFRSAGPDTQPPTSPSNLTAAAVSTSQINLSWTASTDNVGVTGYLVESCPGAGCTNYAQIATVAGTSYSNTGLQASTSYGYRVRATDAAGNLSAYSNTASATTLTPDTQPPTSPSNLAATAASSGQINLSWTASTDNVGVTGYLVERCQGAGCSTFAQIGSTASTAYGDAGLSASTAYGYRVRATDAAGNLSAYSNTASATTLTPDTQPPTSPSNLAATAASSGQ